MPVCFNKCQETFSQSREECHTAAFYIFSCLHLVYKMQATSSVNRRTPMIVAFPDRCFTCVFTGLRNLL